MKAVLQRVCSASVEVENKFISKIDNGILILLGIHKEDTAEDISLLVDKICKLRIFEDEDRKLNLSLSDTKGDIMLVSNFTLLADCKKGSRPSFSDAMSFKNSESLYNEFANSLSERLDCKVEKGIFGADMQVSLVNDGPVTIVLDTKELRCK